MTVDETVDYCLKKKKAVVDYPFGETPICVRLETDCGKRPVFLQAYRKFGTVTVKCDLFKGRLYRETYPDAVKRGYYCPEKQRPYFNTVKIDLITDELLTEMMDESYSLAVASLPKTARKDFE